MQSRTADIVPGAFADEHVEPVDRPVLLAAVQKAGLDPRSAISKDLSLVKIERFKLSFASGMVLVGDVSALREKVKLPAEDADEQTVTIATTSVRS
jgi:hypothetical protein